ncbi:hypothetical protein NAEGRDRAFT_56599 [Naegleria gruberi]|uniref:Uncharacterized protein n=1 Tax=Naegleria gruberi TaxID=5762 RepID=D2UZ35_NAEGR|nr:uncharacterized protein NAEGRDRAFT_56599 [Naegleria gruberi]EFC49876.1 hypothetical protein NAEGRDRAFT_56599 [Naegleria gruberi]|eukprot:XP_002682620.1 hypothetical protein NAEGRDRAFT_56599 [Naegleria gruberi strain NEG-M]
MFPPQPSSNNNNHNNTTPHPTSTVPLIGATPQHHHHMMMTPTPTTTTTNQQPVTLSAFTSSSSTPQMYMSTITPTPQIQQPSFYSPLPTNQPIIPSTIANLPPIPQQFLDHYRMLQETLSQLSVFVPQYNNQTNIVNTLQQQVNGQQQALNNLTNDVKKEKTQLEKLQKSSFTNLIAKTLDKHGHEKKVEKENSEYKIALDRENQARAQLQNIQNQLLQAQSAQSSLLQKVQLFESKKIELNQVTDQIIGAAQLPLTHIIPVTHQNLNVQQSKKNQIMQYLAQYRNGLMNLQQAYSLLQTCYERLSEAKNLATADLFMRGGYANMYVDSMKYENLNRANDDAKRAKMFIAEAVRLCPPLSTQPLFVAKVTQGDFVFDVFFDNFISDYIVHEKIRKSKEAMAESIQHLANTLNWIQTSCLPQIERDMAQTDQIVLSLTSTLENERRNVVNMALEQSKSFSQTPQNFTQVVLPPPQNPSTTTSSSAQYFDPNVVQYSSAPPLDQ